MTQYEKRLKKFGPPDHLTEVAKEWLKLSDQERIDQTRSPLWIGYDVADIVLESLEDLLTYPKRHRMPNLLLVGDTNNGKTSIINEFYQKHLGYDNPEGDNIIVPVLAIQAPEIADEGRLYNAILEALSAPFRHNDRPDKKRFQVLTILKQVEIRMLIIDEIQDLLAGRPAFQIRFLIAVKHLANDLQIPIVGAGTKEAFSVIASDPQLANRFEPVRLPRWEAGDLQDPENRFLRLLASFEKAIPLWKPSILIGEELALKLVSMSEGLIGELSAILVKAAVRAIKTNEEQITIEGLKKIRWVQPSQRKNAQQAAS